MIYLASPYQHPKQEIMLARFEAVCAKAAELTLAGHDIFCPIAHSVPMAKYGLPDEWCEFWEKIDTKWIERSEQLWVYKLLGWEESVGVQREIQIATQIGLPVVYLDCDVAIYQLPDGLVTPRKHKDAESQ